MSDEEYEIIFVPNEGRAVLDKKTKKIYYSEFQIIEEKNEQLNKQKEILDKIKKYTEENKLPEIYYDLESLKPILKHYIDADKILELLEEIE